MRIEELQGVVDGGRFRTSQSQARNKLPALVCEIVALFLRIRGSRGGMAELHICPGTSSSSPRCAFSQTIGVYFHTRLGVHFHSDYVGCFSSVMTG